MYRLYDYPPSGNGYKVRLLLSQLQAPFEYVSLDILEGDTRTDAYLVKNPNGKIPLLEVESGQYLAESNAILMYLGQGTNFVPSHPWQQALMLQWLFFEQYSHEPNIATPRFWLTHLKSLNDYQKAALPYKQEQGYAALDVMEAHLSSQEFFVAQCYTVADIALYAYTHVAGEGGFDLSRYPAIGRWLKRVQEQPGHIPITQETF